MNFLNKKSLLVLIIVVAIASSVLIGCVAIQDVSTDSASEVYHQGLRLFNKGRYEEAKEVFHEYILNYAQTHLYPVSMYYLAYCYQKLNDSVQARLIYNKVIDENQDDFWTQMSQTRLGEMKDEVGGR